MATLLVLTLALLVVATLSATAAYRLSGSRAWQREYNPHGMGLATELITLALLCGVTLTMSIIMEDAYSHVLLHQGWRAGWILGLGGVTGAGVLIYMLILAPRILAREQKVPSPQVGRECRLPYLLYAPYSLVFWLAMILPLVVCIAVSIQADSATLSGEMSAFEETVAQLGASAQADVPAAVARLPLFTVEHAEAVEVVQQVVDRYLWAAGVFILALIFMLNTRITSIFTREANDAFKWVMWLFLAVGVGVGFFGLVRYLELRDLAMAGLERLAVATEQGGHGQGLVAAKTALLELKSAGAVQFLRRVLDGGSLWLLAFTYGAQIIMARMTNRSVVDIIFPSPVAAFLGKFVISGEDEPS